MKIPENDDYKVCFSGTTISKTEANRVGLSLMTSGLAMLGICGAFDVENKVIILLLCFITFMISYSGISKRVFKDKIQK